MYYVSDFLSFISTNTSIDRLEYEPVHFHEQLVEFGKNERGRTDKTVIRG